MITLDLDSSGKLYCRSQITDYIARGDELKDLNLIDFFVNTYEEDITKKRSRKESQNQVADTNAIYEENGGGGVRGDEYIREKQGRKQNMRIPYLETHPKHNQIQRVVRTAGHNNLPNFIGRYFPRRDEPESHSLYCASMLLLLKPWRQVETDLKHPDQTWEEAFQIFSAEKDREGKKISHILAGIQYFHDCETSAAAEVEEGTRNCEPELHQNEFQTLGDEDEMDIDHNNEPVESKLTLEGLEDIIASQTPINETLHARFAIEIARRSKIFSNDDTMWPISSPSVVGNACGDDIAQLICWRNQLESEVQRQNAAVEIISSQAVQDHGSVSLLSNQELNRNTHNSVTPFGPVSVSEVALTAVNPSQLRQDQRRAYDIITWHLDQTLAGHNPPPLRMIIQGEGGTGKSKVIQTVTEAFAARGAQQMLIKAAYTGIAASVIDGKTTHFIGGISLFGNEATLTAEAKAKLQDFWKNYQYLIIDEYSMQAKNFFALLSRNVSIAKEGSPESAHQKSFGGINVIICGDPHQFPPVARAIRDALFYPSDEFRDSHESQVGRAIYEEFETVVVLKEQMRVTDNVWHEFLQHLRHGQVKEHHLKMLRKLVIGKSQEPQVDFSVDPWKSASLITPRHAVRKQWNEAAVRKLCRETGQQLFVCTAQDVVQGRPLTLCEKYCLESRQVNRKGKKSTRSKDLPRTVEFAIGMKVMVTENIEIDLDLTNGARGEIVDIILHPYEPPIGNAPVVHLKYMPTYILVKLSRTRAAALQGLEANVVPIEPATTSYRIKIQQRDGKIAQKTIHRCQYPMTAAYAFTDYRSQGQTLPYVIVDIGSPPTGTLSLFNLYVALSRSSGRNTIRLLRDFKDDLFRASHDPALTAEDERLENLNKSTKEWYQRLFPR